MQTFSMYSGLSHYHRKTGCTLKITHKIIMNARGYSRYIMSVYLEYIEGLPHWWQHRVFCRIVSPVSGFPGGRARKPWNWMTTVLPAGISVILYREPLTQQDFGLRRYRSIVSSFLWQSYIIEWYYQSYAKESSNSQQTGECWHYNKLIR